VWKKRLVERLVKKLLKDKKIKEIRESEGAVIADLREHNLEVLVLIKSDGNVLYGTKDLPLAKKKFDEFNIDKSIYIVDNRQTLYMKQIFKLLELTGYDKQEKIHIPHDFVTLPEGAMASRKGNVVTFEDFYNEILTKAKKETGEVPENVFKRQKLRNFLKKGQKRLKKIIQRVEGLKIWGAVSDFFEGTEEFVDYFEDRLYEISEKGSLETTKAEA